MLQCRKNVFQLEGRIEQSPVLINKCKVTAIVYVCQCLFYRIIASPWLLVQPLACVAITRCFQNPFVTFKCNTNFRGCCDQFMSSTTNHLQEELAPMCRHGFVCPLSDILKKFMNPKRVISDTVCLQWSGSC